MFARAIIPLMLLFLPGAVFAEPKSQTATPPAAFAQETSLAESKVQNFPRPEVEEFIREGNQLMRDGDILGARRVYQKAFASGDAAAALVMGRSYDPIYFAKIVTGNAGPDPVKAFEWYRRAMTAGAGYTATVRIEDLKHFVGQ